MKTFVAKEQEVQKKWFLVDAQSKILGRLAAQIAARLRGKHKAIFTPHADTGDFVVVINADKVSLTGKKWDNKIYYRHRNCLKRDRRMSCVLQSKACSPKTAWDGVN